MPQGGQTTIEQPARSKFKSYDIGFSLWALGCVAILTAPRTMQVGDVETVGSSLLLAAGQEEIAALLKASQDVASAIDTESPAPTSLAGMTSAAADAMRRIIKLNRDRQATVDSFLSAPVLTVHLATEKLNEVEAGLRSLSEPWADPTSPVGRRVLRLLAGIAELERALIHQLTSSGRVEAMVRGARFGRPPKLITDQVTLGVWSTP